MPDKKPPVFNNTTHERYVLDRSPELQNTISEMPNWLMRFGLTATLALMIALTAGASLITFPETISLPIVIQTVKNLGDNSTNISNTDKSLQIDALLTCTTQKVKKGQAITIFLPNTEDCIKGTIIAYRRLDKEKVSIVINVIKSAQEMPSLQMASSCDIQINYVSMLKKISRQITAF